MNIRSIITLLSALIIGLPLQGLADEVELADTPAAVRATIIKELGANPDIEDIHEGEDGGLTYYDVDARSEVDDDNKIDLRIMFNGYVTRREDEIDNGDLPKAVKSVMKKIKSIFRDIDYKSEKVFRNNITYYEIDAEIEDYEARYIILVNGTIVRELWDLNDDANALPKSIRTVLETLGTKLNTEIDIKSIEKTVVPGKVDLYEIKIRTGGSSLRFLIDADGKLL